MSYFLYDGILFYINLLLYFNSILKIDFRFGISVS